MLMTAVPISSFRDPLFSILSEDSEHFYVSKLLMLLGCMAMLVIRGLGPLLLVQYHIYRMRQTDSLGWMRMPQEERN
jgi:hypothetical protein